MGRVPEGGYQPVKIQERSTSAVSGGAADRSLCQPPSKPKTSGCSRLQLPQHYVQRWWLWGLSGATHPTLQWAALSPLPSKL